jgi:hypothetical protein
MIERLGEMVRYSESWNIVTVPMYVPLQLDASTRQWVVRVTLLNGGRKRRKQSSLLSS